MNSFYKTILEKLDTCIERANEIAQQDNEKNYGNYYMYLGKIEVFTGILEEMGYSCRIEKAKYKRYELKLITYRKVGDDEKEFKKEDQEFQEALDYIKEFFVSEYGDEFCNVENLDDIGNDISLAYTELDDSDIPVQVTANLLNLTLKIEVGNITVRTEKYDDLKEMTEIVFARLNFDDLVKISCEEKAFAMDRMLQERND